MTMPVELPDEIARRVQVAASARGISADQVVIQAVEAHLGLPTGEPAPNPFESMLAELQQMVSDGSLRRDIDAVVDDPELAVG